MRLGVGAGYSAAMATAAAPVVLAANAAQVLTKNRTREQALTVQITNIGANPVNLGGSNVSGTVYGYTLAAGATLPFRLAPQDDLWGFSAAGTTVAILTSP